MRSRLFLLGFALLATMVSVYAAPPMEAGNLKGSVTLIEFYDYQCPHCRNMSKTIDQLIQANRNLRVVYRVLPILGENSWFEARAAMAADMQNKFPQFHELLMQQPKSPNQADVMSLAQQAKLNAAQLESDMYKSSVTKALNDNLGLAANFQVAGVPTFIVQRTGTSDSNSRFDGEVPYDTLQNAIAQLKVK